MNKALFLTLDDTIIFTKSGRKYPIHSKDWMINFDSIELITKYNKEGYRIIIVDNQESVAHGFVDERIFNVKIDEIIKYIEQVCILDTNSICFMFWVGKRDEFYQLPNPGLVYECSLEYELSLSNSILVGSSNEDFKLYQDSGIGKYIDIDKLDNE